MRGLSFFAIAVASIPATTDAWSSPNGHSSQPPTKDATLRSTTLQRRRVLQQSVALLPWLFRPFETNAAAGNKGFQTGETLSLSDAKARFRDARDSLNDLVQNYDEITKGGGDNVRRYLGTVGTTSGLYGIQKVMRALQEASDDVIEYTENMAEFEYYLSAADTAVYSANFVEFSAAKTKPEKFFADAKKDVKQMKTYMDQMATSLEL